MKKIYLILICGCLLRAATLTATFGFSGGSGTSGNPYLISNRAQLDNLRNYLGAVNRNTYFRLTTDIDLSGSDWKPIGDADNKFQGNLDGAGYRIFNLNIGQNGSTYQYTGLFGYLFTGASVRNLHIASGKIKGGGTAATNATGSIAGITENTVTIENCTNKSEITGGDATTRSCAGGIVGYVYASSATANVLNCVNYGSVTGGNAENGFTGGIVGFTVGRDSNGIILIDRCINFGAVTGKGSTESGTGGITGYCYCNIASTVTTILTRTTISKCANSGNINGAVIANAHVGGIVGWGYSYGFNNSVGPLAVSYFYINDSYNTGKIHARNGNAGGIAGRLTVNGTTSNEISRCYASGNITGNAEYAGSLEGYTQMRLYESVAASASVQGRNAHRVQGTTLNNGRRNLYANADMLVNGNKVTSDDAASVQGEGKKMNDLFRRETYSGTPMSWNFSSVWDIRPEETSLPYFIFQAAPPVVESLGKTTFKVNNRGTSDSLHVYRYTAKNGFTYLQTVVKPVNTAKGYVLATPVTANDTLAFLNYDNASSRWAPSYPVFARGAANEDIEMTCTVTFNTQGGSNIAPVTVPAGNKITRPADPTRNGFTFGGWYRETACINAWNFNNDAVDNDITLYAKWEETVIPTFTVTFDSQGGSAVASQTIERGGKVTKPADPAREKFTFGGWFKEAACTNAWNFDTDVVNGNITLYAKWTAVTVTGEAETLRATSLQIYPNPFTDALRIMVADAVETWRAASLQVQVINTAGIIVHHQIIISADETIQLSHLPAGIYIIRLEKDGHVKTVKVVKN